MGESGRKNAHNQQRQSQLGMTFGWCSIVVHSGLSISKNGKSALAALDRFGHRLGRKDRKDGENAKANQ